MNNNNESINIVLELSKQIEQLRQENYELRQEIQRLRSQEINNNSNSNDTALTEYYISRYEEIHNYVLENRIRIIDEEISKAQASYDQLVAREDLLGDIASKNESIKKELAEIQIRLESNSNQLVEKQSIFDKIASNVTDMENNLYLTTINYYNHVLAKLSIGNYIETMSYVKFLMDVLKFTFYDEVVNYHEQAKIALKVLDDLTDLQTRNKNEELALSIRKNELESQIEEISFEEIESKLDSFAYEIANQKKIKEELTQLFINLKEQNIKVIKDEFKHLKLLDMSNQEIGTKLDQIVIDYKESLMNVDTNSNILLHKKNKLNKLNAEIQAIYGYKQDFDNINEEYNQLQNMYQTVTANIEELEDYIATTKKLIDSNITFKKTITEYDELKVKMNSLKENIDSYVIREKNLAEARKTVLNDPYGKTDLLRIDEELRLLQESLQGFNSEYLSLETKLYTLKETEQDYKLITVYEEFKSCELQLPQLYEQQRSLSSLINDKYMEVSNLKMKCANYDELVKQIEELEDEIKNF